MKISNIGVTELVSESRKNKIRLVNIFSLIASFIFIVNGFINTSINDSFSGGLLISFGIFTLFTLLLNYLHLYVAAINYLFAIIILGTFYFDSYSGIESGTYLFYFPILLGIANIFDFTSKNDRYYVIIQSGILIILASINVATDYKLFESEFLSVTQKDKMFKTNLLSALISLSYFIYLILKNNLYKLELLRNIVKEENKSKILESEKNKEKEILLAEIQHRIKNNLSLINSLINLKFENPLNKKPEFIHHEINHAIQTLGSIYHYQHFEQSHSKVLLNSYLPSLIKNLDYQNDKNLKNQIKIECNSEIALNTKQSITLGLFIHQLLSDYCFISISNKLKNNIFFVVEQNNSEISIEIKSDFSLLNIIENNEIINSLIEQLDASIQKDSEQVTIIWFNIENEKTEIDSEKLF